MLAIVDIFILEKKTETHFSKKFGHYSIMNRQEVLSWFLGKRRENQNACKRCQKSGCHTCHRFEYIREQLQKNAFFEAQDWLRQPVLWQIFDSFEKELNKYDKNIYRFRVFIERTVKSDVLKKKSDFVNNKIIEKI